MEMQQSLCKLRSYVNLYTSIRVSKLASFNDLGEAEFVLIFLCYKQKMRHLEQGANFTGDEDD